MSNYTKSTNFATKDNLTPGDPLKIVRGTEIDTEFNNIATAIATKTDNASAAITGGSITGITDLAIADGGTGASTANAALNNLLPSQASASGKYLKSNGTDSSWDALDISTADITGTLPVANGGTGVTSSTGTGSVVLSNSPTLVTPALGTPASGVATNLTGLPLTTGVTGTLPIANGGTGQTTANAAFNALAPSQVTASGKYLKSDGTNTSWDALDISTADITGTLPVANGGTGVTTSTGTGSVVLSNSPTLVTPALGTPSSATLTNATGLPISTGVSGLGTGVATALAVNVGSAGAPVVNGGALGTPSSGTVTNLTGTASININGTVGATTPTTGAFTTTTVSTSETLSYGTANGVTYLNGSKVLTSGSALTFNGTAVGIGGSTITDGHLLNVQGSSATSNIGIVLNKTNATAQIWGITNTGPLAFYNYTNSSEAARFDISNNFGLGVTPSGNFLLEAGTTTAAGRSFKLMTLTGGYSGGNYPFFGYNFRSTTTSGVYKYDATDVASAINFGSGIAFNIAASGTAGTNISFTQAMTLDASGNLGVGTTSPLGRLHIETTSGSAAFFVNSPSATDVGSYISLRKAGSAKFLMGVESTLGGTSDNGLLYVYGANALTMYTNGSERARIDSSGNLLVGATSTAGSSSNTQRIVGGNFRTFINGPVTVGASATATVLTLSSSVTGVYIVNANFGGQGNEIYGGMAIIVANNGSFRIVTNGGGSRSALSLSGANVQITNALGIALDATASAIFIGN